ncbi:ABC transporter ATP-binding protein [Ornithinibacillus halophilus]|uniref:ABC-2 type transport system ATP-binding protein n=1 Tax=Ornithinibacillus halophilus TaxID=930117 RepID=A0A1M5IP09_9BACI|nr:ABC transporter ATP-binding protein [Ornithinibacillus halophilus]SHG30027.1 ABC-2 type transport system ATP-binding protein [Ornithinibacillus halophilus]
MIVQVDNLTKKYKKEWVLQGVQFEINHPQIVAIVGPNGSGKTTLFNCMTNLLSINSGTIKVLEKDYKDTSLFYDVSYLQDNRILYENLTAYDHLQFVCSVMKQPSTKIVEVAKRVGMESYLKKPVQKFSLGMKQHLLLAMAIINNPKLLLMDEPLNGLDPSSAINMRKILLELYEEGTTIMISSHNLDEIDRLTNTIFFMKDGQILEESLKNYNMKQYFLNVNNLAQAKDKLNELSVSYTVNKDDQVVFYDNETSFQDVLIHLNQNDVLVEDIDIKRIGAEKRYLELFERTVSE